MRKKSIYTSSELPDGTLEEFQEVENIFLALIDKLSEKYNIVSINAGMSKAMLDILSMCDKKSAKKVLLNQAEYFLQAAEKIEDT